MIKICSFVQTGVSLRIDNASCLYIVNTITDQRPLQGRCLIRICSFTLNVGIVLIYISEKHLYSKICESKLTLSVFIVTAVFFCYFHSIYVFFLFVLFKVVVLRPSHIKQPKE